MGELIHYRQFIAQILSDYAEFLSGDPTYEPLLVMDERHDHYQHVQRLSHHALHESGEDAGGQGRDDENVDRSELRHEFHGCLPRGGKPSSPQRIWAPRGMARR